MERYCTVTYLSIAGRPIAGRPIAGRRMRSVGCEAVLRSGPTSVERRVVAKPVRIRHSPATVIALRGASPVADLTVHARTFERKVGRTVRTPT
jgi:hypothetical protein